LSTQLVKSKFSLTLHQCCSCETKQIFIAFKIFPKQQKSKDTLMKFTKSPNYEYKNENENKQKPKKSTYKMNIV